MIYTCRRIAMLADHEDDPDRGTGGVSAHFHQLSESEMFHVSLLLKSNDPELVEVARWLNCMD
jgi:hypothetical protein